MKLRVSRQILIPSLMIVSGILLTMFVIHWFINQYQATEATIHKDVLTDVNISGEQLFDVVVQNYFKEVFNIQDSTTVIGQPKKQFSFKFDYGQPSLKELKGIDIRTEKTHKTPMINLKKTDLPNHTEELVIVNSKLRSNDKKDVNGLDNYVKQIISTYSSQPDLFMLSSSKIDSRKYKQILDSNWQLSGLEYKLVKLKSHSLKKASGTKYFYPSNPLVRQVIVVQLTNYNNYLFMELIPELLFGIGLMLFINGAFIFAYRSYRKQLQINQLRSEFVNNISHELKTPVTTVRVALEALQFYNRKEDPKFMQEYLHLMSMEVNRLDTLIHQVLNTSLSNSGHNFLNLASVDLTDLIIKTIKTFQWQAEQGKVKIITAFSEKPVDLMIDSVHVQGVIGNLIDNCLKYAENGSEIKITVINSLSEVQVLVSDDGPGVPKEYLPYLYDKFFRVPNGNKHRIKGFGLGLGYCKQIMELHNGNISIKNNHNKGCVVILSFPV